MQIRISIDDGHKYDLQILTLLKKHGLQDLATFYIAPYNNQIPVMPPSHIRILSQDAEIGAHTLTHPVLTKLSPDNQLIEIMEGRKVLEDITGKKITRFAYPRGWYNDETKRSAQLAGVKEARTMKQGATHTDALSDPYAIPITIHTHPHHINGWKEALETAKANGDKGYFHITMHGWEIDKFQLWEKINEIFYEIARSRN